MNNEIVSFDQLGLSEKVLAAVADMGYDCPTPVQAGAIPAILQGSDVMAAAQTGTGKTAAFLLPSLDRLGHARRGQGVLMLVVTPTRELAQQIEACARTICAHTGHTCTVVVGGVGYEPQKAALARGCDLLIATPGRLIDLIEQGAADLSHVETLVLDEADRMLDMGFAPAMRRIVSKTPASRQTLLFSATLDDNVLANVKSLVNDPVRVEIAHKGTAAQTIDQYVLGVSEREKVRILTDVLKQEGSKRVIVFCRGKHRADMVCRKLTKAGISAAPIHGNRSQNQREAALRRFATGEADVLVATDVLARGIDIAEVSYVVNLDVPSDAEDYIHRIGRTGRAGQFGWALTFVSEAEYLDLRDIEALMGKLVPDFPRAAGIDCGQERFELDPSRKPTDKLPSKKARKKLAEQRAAAQEGNGAQARREASASDGGQAGGARRGGARQATEDGRGAGRSRRGSGETAAQERASRPHNASANPEAGTSAGRGGRRANHLGEQGADSARYASEQGAGRAGRAGGRRGAEAGRVSQASRGRAGEGRTGRSSRSSGEGRPATGRRPGTADGAAPKPRRRPGDHGGGIAR